MKRVKYHRKKDLARENSRCYRTSVVARRIVNEGRNITEHYNNGHSHNLSYYGRNMRQGFAGNEISYVGILSAIFGFGSPRPESD